jgi:L-threonylcarbamoyladenylate synthase
VAQIFAAKGRPANHPLIVHVADAAAITRYAKEVPVFAQQLIDAFWPGPLTLILPRLPHAAKASTGGQDSVGLRCPSHPVAHAVLQACQQLDPPVWGVSAPSANKFGRVSPTTAEHVATEFGEELLVLDGGACEVGIESTIVDCTRGVPVLLRPGAITRDDIERACGLRPLSKEELTADTPRASGTLLAHYAPNAKVRLMDARQLQSALDILGRMAGILPSITAAPQCHNGPAAAAPHVRRAARRGPRAVWHAAQFRRLGRQADLDRNPARHRRLGRRARPPAACGGCGLRGLLADF